jgi:hypothetical protein
MFNVTDCIHEILIFLNQPTFEPAMPYLTADGMTGMIISGVTLTNPLHKAGKMQ